MAYLEMQDLLKRFGAFTAVNHVNLAIDKGELYSLVGPSGCGKTTTMRMVAGFITPEEGKILLNGEDITHRPINKRSTAMVFQNYALFPHKTVEDNIGFGLRMHKVPKDQIKKKVEEVLDLISLPGVEKKYPSQLSGGQQQRIALARALVLEPDVLLLDEPLSNLDAKLRENLRMELREIQQKVGITTIFVTHDISEAFAMSDRIAVMNAGQIEQISHPVDIYEKPVNPFVGAFVGKSNSFSVQVESCDNGLTTCVTEAGVRLKMCGKTAYAVGSKGSVMVRPEHIELSAAPTKRDNCIAAHIARSYYLGNQTHFEVDIPGKTVIIEMLNTQGNRFHKGDDIYISWGGGECVYHPEQ